MPVLMGAYVALKSVDAIGGPEPFFERYVLTVMLMPSNGFDRVAVTSPAASVLNIRLVHHFSAARFAKTQHARES